MNPILFILIAACSLYAVSQQEKTQKMKETELALLKSYVENARDSLENEIAQRYILKQRSVDQREADKQDLDRLRETQERAANDLARVKEEYLAREQTLTDERKLADAAKEEWSFIVSALQELFKKDADAVIEAFPADREARRLSLERVRSLFASTNDPAQAWKSYMDYTCNDLRCGCAVSISASTVLMDQGLPRKLTVARFGNVFGLAVDSSGQPFMIRQTGHLGQERYALDKVGSPELAAFIGSAMPRWLGTGKADGAVLTEVLQNDQSRILVSGKKTSTLRDLYESMKKGGLVMIPMLLLPFWAGYLTVRKSWQIVARRRRFGSHFREAMALLEKNDLDTALAFVRKKKGSMARILEVCIERKEHGRHVSELAVREIIMQEVPAVSGGINTLAVIAGAAPLLGLLGTISGMITLFAAVTQYGTGDPKFLANGISEALITAKTGLAIAIPVLFIHDLVRNGKDGLLSELERLSIAAMNRIWPEE
jgi:biopolymer transport protein ExbB